MIPDSDDSAVASFVDIFLGLDSQFRESLDQESYRKLGQLRPVLGSSAQKARFCIMGRDPGDTEVQDGRPFVGQTGTDLRDLLKGYIDPESGVYWANTVPFKRKGNKVWPKSVQQQFFEPTLELLVTRWRGHEVITLGEHAFKWFAMGMESSNAREWLSAWDDEETRFKPETGFNVSLRGRDLTVYPLPHPSKASPRYSKVFPSLLRARLNQMGCTSGTSF
jgi:uracil-DNA glycosylase family 4